ncbi:MAG TPA: hypothetical protein VGR51_00300 [Thermoplasmata archaeon]|nr:hypothetical protein [Thermoplasmata archaeon]
MAVAPDSRYYVHTSTHAARAQQQYLLEEAVLKGPPTARAGTRIFDFRTDWWIVVAILALGAFMVLLALFVR